MLSLWKNKKVSVIFPTYNEKESIYYAIQDFFSTGYIDEIIVVNNNAAPGTSEEVAKTKAIEIFEKKQGYGYAIRSGLKEAKGDILIISEPDGTFLGKDVLKLLAYSNDFEVVFGTRTRTALIEKDADMGLFLRVGNWTLAKIIEFLFNTTSLSDVGCTMRLFKREALEKIRNKFTIGGSQFGPEMMLLTILNDIKFVEIPVHYTKRIGKSSVTGNKFVAFILGLNMLRLISRYRIKSIFWRKKK